jgi:hypothetical protein
VLLGLADYTMAPVTPWSSDRSPVFVAQDRRWRRGRR